MNSTVFIFSDIYGPVCDISPVCMCVCVRAFRILAFQYYTGNGKKIRMECFAFVFATVHLMIT